MPKMGKATPDRLLAVTDYDEPRKLRGVHAGVTKRTRRLLGNREAYLIGWRDDSGEDWDGEWYVTPVTLLSMNRYFEVE